jgi:hypothetical protein
MVVSLFDLFFVVLLAALVPIFGARSALAITARQNGEDRDRGIERKELITT